MKTFRKVGLPLEQALTTDASEDVLIRVEDVHRIYRVGQSEVHALKGIKLTISPGRLIALKGRSGSGKTTLLNLIGGLDHPTEGRIIYRGRDLRSFSQKDLTKWRRTEIGFIFQAFALMPALTALENVELPLRIAGMSPRKSVARAREALDLVGLSKRAHHRSYELSGGEQQRVGIARALAGRPRLIIADEPTGELDQATGIQIMTLFRSVIESEGVAICMTTHDPVASAFADVTYLLEDGVMTLEQADGGTKPE